MTSSVSVKRKYGKRRRSDCRNDKTGIDERMYADTNHGMHRSQPSGAHNQAAALQAEGVAVSTDALGELSVDLAEYGWFPNVLPSEEADEEQGWESEDES